MNPAVEKSGTGITHADWVAVTDQVPAQAQPVLIAYLFDDDEELTVDMGERDGDQWMYLGGGPIEHGTVYLWAHPPACPALANVARGVEVAGLVELVA